MSGDKGAGEGTQQGAGQQAGQQSGQQTAQSTDSSSSSRLYEAAIQPAAALPVSFAGLDGSTQAATQSGTHISVMA